jgi:hypothetical protein
MWKATAVMILAACGASDGDGDGEGEVYAPLFDPARFPSVDNPYFPLAAATSFEYQVLETDELVTVTVTGDTRVVMGVTAIVVHEYTRSNNQLVEDTYDWYASDVDGNVWYLGEDTTSYEGGTTSKEGSWEAGVDGALPGILIPGTPRVGQTYRQAYLEGQVEDHGEVVAVDANVTTSWGAFTWCLVTRDFSPLEPDIEQNKYYCAGTGLVRAISTKGDAATEDLYGVSQE